MFLLVHVKAHNWGTPVHTDHIDDLPPTSTKPRGTRPSSFGLEQDPPGWWVMAWSISYPLNVPLGRPVLTDSNHLDFIAEWSQLFTTCFFILVCHSGFRPHHIVTITRWRFRLSVVCALKLLCQQLTYSVVYVSGHGVGCKNKLKNNHEIFGRTQFKH